MTHTAPSGNDRPLIFVALTQQGAELARDLQKHFPGAQLHGVRGRVDQADSLFEKATAHLAQLFEAGNPIVGICASGILIRAIGPALGDKTGEPPVLALAEDASVVVPLLGGHRGANSLAERIGKILDAVPAVTTAGDRRFGVALDAPPVGWRLANPQHYKDFTASLLSGAEVRIKGDAPWLSQSRLPQSPSGELSISVMLEASAGSSHELIYHPTRLAIGIGCERNADPEEVLALAEAVLAEEKLSPLSLAGVFSVDVKADEAAVHAVADHFGVPARFFAAARLEAETPRLANPSDLVFQEVGCHGVAEGAALAAAGPEGRLLLPKRKSKRATAAVAVAPRIIDPNSVGRPRGRLSVLGLGPGDQAWRTPQVAAEVARASDLVGYGLYLDLLGNLTQGKSCHAYALGEEERRVRAALDLAAEGRSVALICSGDPGIYAMAALVFELLDQVDKVEWRRLDIVVAPGISALQAAAARIGAPLGHDFCAISLSDLLTPWEAIEQRLHAAAKGDFVVAFYNPVSKRRTQQFATALEILRGQRPPDTPVVLGRNLGRPGEKVTVYRLDEVGPDQVDMLTLVLVGSSASRRISRPDGGEWVYTPRGYEKKRIAVAASSDDDATDPVGDVA
ncbi:MAG: precorrin-3B C(17)-methyltransferase [Pseudomonadota bacterium]